MKTFNSWKGILLWYIIGGALIVLPAGVIYAMDIRFFSVGVIALTWPFYFMMVLIMGSQPGVGIECPNVAPNIWGYELHVLEVISPFLILIIISLALSELILIGLSRRKQRTVKI